MTCTRCSGLMVVDHILDMQESYLSMWMQTHRCLACGNIVDPMIHHQRMLRRTRRAKRLTTRLVLAKKGHRPAGAA